MPKIKPLLLFIITSIALHWWVLSLPIFQRIKSLEKTSVTNSAPTIVAKLSNLQTPIEPQKSRPEESSDKESLVMANQSQQLPAPYFLHGSPWLRRPAENRPNNFGAPSPPVSALTQFENLLQTKFTDLTSNLQCKRVGVEQLFICQGSNNIDQSEKVAKVLNQFGNSSAIPIPSCIDIEILEKKWHAKACH